MDYDKLMKDINEPVEINNHLLLKSYVDLGNGLQEPVIGICFTLLEKIRKKEIDKNEAYFASLLLGTEQIENLIEILQNKLELLNELKKEFNKHK